MEECEFLAKCPIYARFRFEGMKNIFIQSYCKGPMQDRCARKKLKKEGKEVPITLLPNGVYLKELAEQE